MTRLITHTDSQIAEILREARRTSINEAATKYQISVAAIHSWHSKFGHLSAEEIRRFRHLKMEHARRRRSILK
jgi:hypothetical protein